MSRPDVEKMDAFLDSVLENSESWWWKEPVAPLTDARRAVAFLTEATIHLKHLEAILREWLTVCPQTCGQCDEVRARAEEAGK